MHSAIKNIRLLQVLLFVASFCVHTAFSQGTVQHSATSTFQYPVVANDSITSHDSAAGPYFTIRNIVTEGNKITNKKIILRELSFKAGDSIRIKDIPKNFEEAKFRLMNTSLFHEVQISVLQFEGFEVDIKIWVDERWYIIPSPHLKPVDRNISQWIFKERASFNRVDYGLKLHWNNMTGNNDKLRLYFITGYTRQLVLSYRRPFIDKNMKWGIYFDMSVGKNHELNYNTINNKQSFVKFQDKEFARNFFKTNMEASYRPAFYTTHSFGIGYTKLRVNDFVLKLNPNFFNIPGNTIYYPEIYYKLIHRNFDYNPYPTRGHAAELTLLKQGFSKDVNVTQLTLKGIKYWPFNKKFFYSIGATGTVKVPFKQPYYFSQLLGYGDFYLRGYEFYVIDGVAGGIVNTTLTHQLTNFKIHIPGTKWFTPRLIPLKIYGKVFGNVGYGYQKPPLLNSLNNKLVFGGGFGFDVVTMYDFNLKIEWSFNQLGQNGIYLQKKSTFQ